MILKGNNVRYCMKKRNKGKKAWLYSKNNYVDRRPAEGDFEVIVDYKLNVSHVK